MRDELTSKLEAALDREHAPRSPDLGWVLARGHRLRVRRLLSVAMSAVVITATLTTVIAVLPSGDDARSPLVAGDPSAPSHESISPQAPREGEVVEEIPEQQRAEVFAFRALADTGLMDPFGKRSFNWTYENDTTRTPQGSWRIGFASSDCEPRDNSFGCRGLSGEDPETGNALADTFVVVELSVGAWHVVDIEGNVLEEERDRVVGYQLPDRMEPSHWESPAVNLWPVDDGFAVTMFPLWVGPYPTKAPGSVCTIELRNGNGEVVGDRLVRYRERPQREFERAGTAYSLISVRADGADGVQVECRQYSGPGWEVASGPQIVGGPGMVSGITIELVWRGEEGFTAAALCRATLVDEAGEVVWEGSGRVLPLWWPNELKDYPYRTDVHVTVRGGPVDAQGLGDFSCKSL